MIRRTNHCYLSENKINFHLLLYHNTKHSQIDAGRQLIWVEYYCSVLNFPVAVYVQVNATVREDLFYLQSNALSLCWLPSTAIHTTLPAELAMFSMSLHPKSMKENK